MTEFSLVEKISEFLNNEGYLVHLEIPNMGQSVDIVAQKESDLTFIEVKLNNWKRALSQCKNHQIVADYIFVAIASKKISEKFKEAADNLGFGIIHYNKQLDVCLIHSNASKNPHIWKPQRIVLIDKFEKIKKYGHSTLDDVRNFC